MAHSFGLSLGLRWPWLFPSVNMLNPGHAGFLRGRSAYGEDCGGQSTLKTNGGVFLRVGLHLSTLRSLTSLTLAPMISSKMRNQKNMTMTANHFSTMEQAWLVS